MDTLQTNRFCSDQSFFPFVNAIVERAAIAQVRLLIEKPWVFTADASAPESDVIAAKLTPRDKVAGDDPVLSFYLVIGKAWPLKVVYTELRVDCPRTGQTMKTFSSGKIDELLALVLTEHGVQSSQRPIRYVISLSGDELHRLSRVLCAFSKNEIARILLFRLDRHGEGENELVSFSFEEKNFINELFRADLKLEGQKLFGDESQALIENIQNLVGKLKEAQIKL